MLEIRSSVAPKYAKLMVKSMEQLHRMRQNSQIFAGSSGSFLTSRDLFRWAHRSPSASEDFIHHAFALFGERLRNQNDKDILKVQLSSICLSPKFVQVGSRPCSVDYLHSL